MFSLKSTFHRNVSYSYDTAQPWLLPCLCVYNQILLLVCISIYWYALNIYDSSYVHQIQEDSVFNFIINVLLKCRNAKTIKCELQQLAPMLAGLLKLTVLSNVLTFLG